MREPGCAAPIRPVARRLGPLDGRVALAEGAPGRDARLQHELGLGRLGVAGALAHGVDVDDATLVEPSGREAVDLDDDAPLVDRPRLAS